ncbi:hypothetical protein OSB04_031780 [Centaurea solstitialis]|uniref:Reverse transcriptase Ty1/copia-type domain-containing protein n=1 Tax=Centaurea solstitialis TaxID=347529 RepID=A0AA38VUP2_9ASTR|nr:hypothetical protein OSB04_031780 [Centaurea solstitialis]
MGELTFFLGLQVKQKEDGILINQSKYVRDMLIMDAKSTSTPMETHRQLTADVEGEEVDVHQYRSMIGSLMYLTASRPDITFAVCVCARFQVRPKDSHLQAVKRIFRYLKGQPRLGLWYPYESPFELLAYTDSDYGGASLDRKSTSGGCQFLGARLVSWQLITPKLYISMASALVCLATNQIFNFSQMIFDALVYNLENIHNSKVKTFYMFPRFVQEVITRELSAVPMTGDIYKSSALGHKVFANMKRPAKGSNDQFTPLFSTMMRVNHPQGEASDLQPTQPSIPSDDLPTPITDTFPQSLEKTPTLH